MERDEITKLVNDMVQENLSRFKDEQLAFRRWNPQDSVTDQFSPITGASGQIAFFGTSKIAQPTNSGASATFVDSGATTVHTASTFDGYTLAQVVKALRNLGLLK